MKKLVIIHTTPATIPSLGQLVGNLSQPWQVANLLDDSILPEINQAGAITPGVRARLYTQLAMAQTLKPDAILCACSSIGGVIEEGSSFCSVPVLRIDGPMAEAAVNAGSRIAVLAALPSTLGPTTDLILRKAKAAGRNTRACCRFPWGNSETIFTRKSGRAFIRPPGFPLFVFFGVRRSYGTTASPVFKWIFSFFSRVYCI